MAKGTRIFKTGEAQTIGWSTGKAPIILTVHSFTTGTHREVTVEAQADKGEGKAELTWGTVDLHKAYHMILVGRIKMTFIDLSGPDSRVNASEVMWEFE